MSAATKTTRSDPRPEKFTPTRWTDIVGPSGEGDLAALDLLARAYWYPLYWFVRRKGAGEHDAEDQVQSFFAHLLTSSTLKAAKKTRGKFRTFLLTAFHRFLISAWRKGANDPPIDSLDELIEARGDAQAPSVEDNRDTDFYRDWAITLLNLALQRLQAEQQALGRGELFDQLKGHLGGASNLAGLSDVTGIPVNTLKSDLSRLRKRLRLLLVEEVQRTLNGPTDAELEQELRFILHYATGGPPV